MSPGEKTFDRLYWSHAECAPEYKEEFIKYSCVYILSGLLAHCNTARMFPKGGR